MATCGCDILYLYNDRAGDCIYLYIFSRNSILVHEIQYMTEIMYKMTDRIFRLCIYKYLLLKRAMNINIF